MNPSIRDHVFFLLSRVSCSLAPRLNISILPRSILVLSNSIEEKKEKKDTINGTQRNRKIREIPYLLPFGYLLGRREVLGIPTPLQQRREIRCTYTGCRISIKYTGRADIVGQYRPGSQVQQPILGCALKPRPLFRGCINHISLSVFKSSRGYLNFFSA